MSSLAPLLDVGGGVDREEGEQRGRWWTWTIDGEEAGQQLVFAVPMVITNLSYYSITVISVMFAGHLGDPELAGATLGNSWGTVTGIALMTGLSGALETLCGQGYGAKLYRMLGIYLQSSIITSIFFSVLVSILWYNTELILIWLHQDPQVSKMAGLYLKYLIPGLFAYGFLQGIMRFLQTQTVTTPLVVCSVIPLILHIGITYLLVHVVGLGFKGASLSGSISLWISFLMLALYVNYSEKFKYTWEGLSMESFQHVIPSLKLAIPSAVMVCLEYWAFELLVLLAGLMPNSERSTSVIAMCVNTEAIAYMITYGFSAVVSTRVSNELGAGNTEKAKNAVSVTLKLSIFLALSVVLLLALGHNIWASFFSSSSVIIREFANMTPLLAVSILFDSAQGILSGVSRGCGWQHLAAWTNLVAFYAIGMLLAILFGFKLGLHEKRLFLRRDSGDPSAYSPWNITGTYRGRWSFVESTNGSSRFLDFGKSNGVSVLELVSTPTKINGIHYVQGSVVFHDVFDNKNDHGVAQMRVEGVYIWPFRQLRMVANSGTNGETHQEDYFLSNPYHLLGVFSSQVFQESSRDKIHRTKKSLTYEVEKHCNIEIAAQVSHISSSQNDGDHERYHLEGLMESPAIDDDGECFSPIALNATSLNIEVYYNKAVNYTLMVTFVSFLQVLLLIRQMEHSNTQSGAAKVSILMIGQQAIVDAYLCLLHLTAGILVESLFNAFATAAFFKFVVFSLFEMRYLLAIWKARRPMNNGEGWETMRRELSVLYSRFYGILLGGILIIYELHNFLRPILFIMYSFWIPQIIANVIRDTRKPLHPYYILGMTLTRLAIPLYLFGCPSNFMRIEVDKNWCIFLVVFMGLQASVLLLQHCLGSRCFIPRQILPEKYSYYRRLKNDLTQAIDCVICMASIDLTQCSNDYMVTPCDHFFHSGCLQRWMDIKMECPTCRRSLPPS